jgi:hypothetical protein
VKLVTQDTPRNIRLSILSGALTLQDGLKQWYSEYTSTDGCLRNPILVETSYSPENMFPSIYVYRDTLSASVITTYYAYLIVLNRQIDCLDCEGSYIEENFELARAICMSVDYCSQAGYCGTQTMRFSLPIAFSALPVEYHRWTEECIEKFSDTPKAAML